ncbi:hypothetical protein EWU23_06305 [Cytophagaceae bacterium 50C-KIRBA]|uniref:Small multi-drug export protein n=1 Tax=Aquirufa beregesia TaxID=2516556 RepID=A0ABX0EU74_9BACT|nr:hypothetical protein [Aquirufa beregesia]NGZ44080.1 hypothetical protein [Aquirufa beregesia]
MDWSSYSAVMAATAIKFIAGPITGFSLGLSWVETILFTWLGMMITVSFMISLGQWLVKYIAKWRNQKPLVFSKRARLAVKIWTKFGIKGIAACTPLFLTPIGGSLLALSFKVPLPRILFFMAISAFLWAGIYTALIYQLDFIRDYFMDK